MSTGKTKVAEAALFLSVLIVPLTDFGAETKVLTNETFQLDTKIGTAADLNSYNSWFDCTGDCIIECLPPSAAGTCAFRPRIRVNANSTLTVDMTRLTGSALEFNGGFYGDETAKIILKGAIGDTIVLSRGNAETDDATVFCTLNAPNVEFQDADGQKIRGTFRLAKSTLLCQLPDPEDVTISIGSGARVTAENAEVLSFLKNVDGEVVVGNFILGDFCNGAIPKGTTVRVSEGGVYDVFPAKLNDSLSGITTGMFADWTSSTDVILEGTTSTLLFSCEKRGTFAGTVSGSSAIQVWTHHKDCSYTYGDRGELITLANPLAFSGGELNIGRGGVRILLPSAMSVGRITGESAAVASSELRIADASSLTYGSTVDGLGLQIRNGGSLALSAGTGRVSATGSERKVSSLSVETLAEGGRIDYDTTVGATLAPSAPSSVHWVKNGNAGSFFTGAVDLGALGLDGTGVLRLELSGSGNEITKVAGNYEIDLADAATSVTISDDTTSSPVVEMNGGAVTLKSDDTVDKILNRAAFWADASAEGSWTQVVDTEGNLYNYTVAYGDLKGLKYPSVYYWYDCRGRKASAYYVRKTDTNNIKVPSTGSTITYTNPYLVTNGAAAAAGPYLSWDTRSAETTYRACRSYFYNSVSGNATNVSPKLIVMVYGSQAGGGKAIFGTPDADGVFTRAGMTTASPILPAGVSDCSIWLDGEKQANPTDCYFNGGWQVISFDPAGRKLNGIGNNNTTTTNGKYGGQNIAEMLMFDEALTDVERQRVEIYLAEKWGLKDAYKGGAYHPAPVEARVNGAGTVTLGDDAKLGGVYSGTIDLGGKWLTLPLPAPDEMEVAAIADRCGWFDPSYSPSVSCIGSSRSCRWLTDRVLGDADGVYRLYGNGYERSATRRDDGWLDFRAKTSTGVNPDGAVMRFNTTSEGTTTVTPLTVRTIVMAQDSSAGGGTPYLAGTSVATGSSRIASRISSTGSCTTDDYRTPIWSSSTAAKYRTGSTLYLDGVETDGNARGFNGRPEVFTSVFDADFQLGCFGDYQHNTCTNVAGEVQGEIIGEILCFSRELEPAERKTVEAYLAGKWCGRSLAGYGDFSAATLTGAGKVIVPSGAALPTFARTFTGEVAISDTALAFTVADGAIADPLVAENGTLSFPSAVTVKVSGGRLSAGDYTLVDSAGIASGTTWTLDVAGATGPLAQAELVPQGGKLILRVPSTGAMIILR